MIKWWLKSWLGCVVSLILFLSSGFRVSAQFEPTYSQYTLNPIVSNPGFTGFKNVLSFDLSVRKQWLGMEGAPTSTFLSAHSPINNSKVSLGTYLHHWQAGPLAYNNFALSYSYIIRLNDVTFVSLGMNLGIVHQQLNFSSIVLVDPEDPNFGQEPYNSLIPSMGVGAVLFSPSYYVGFARPTIPLAYINLSESSTNEVNLLTNYNFTAGYLPPALGKIETLISTSMQLNGGGTSLISFSGQVDYSGIAGIGVSYKLKQCLSYMLHLQFNKNIGITYSYDMPLAEMSYAQQASHEITLSYDSFIFYKKNKYRATKKKKEPTEAEMRVRSIRNF